MQLKFALNMASEYVRGVLTMWPSKDKMVNNAVVVNKVDQVLHASDFEEKCDQMDLIKFQKKEPKNRK